MGRRCGSGFPSEIPSSRTYLSDPPGQDDRLGRPLARLVPDIPVEFGVQVRVGVLQQVVGDVLVEDPQLGPVVGRVAVLVVAEELVAGKRLDLRGDDLGAGGVRLRQQASDPQGAGGVLVDGPVADEVPGHVLAELPLTEPRLAAGVVAELPRLGRVASVADAAGVDLPGGDLRGRRRQ
jgi:hypothetical protein